MRVEIHPVLPLGAQRVARHMRFEGLSGELDTAHKSVTRQLHVGDTSVTLQLHLDNAEGVAGADSVLLRQVLALGHLRIALHASYMPVTCRHVLVRRWPRART